MTYDYYANDTSDATPTNATTIEHDSEDTRIAAVDAAFRYKYVVPVLIASCVVTFGINVVVIVAFPLVRNVSRYQSPYITFVLSLVISDAFASFLLGFQLLTGSYLPVVHGVQVNTCLLLAAEALKLTGILVTVLHLLVMVSIHLGGVNNPVRFKRILTLNACRGVVVALWVLPFLGIAAPFCLIPGQAFRSAGCASYDFLLGMPFRAAFSALIVAPTAAILLLYLKFHVLLWQRDLLVAHNNMSTLSRQNIRAARITLLIISTCTVGWIPAVVNFLLVCPSDCKYKPSDLSAETLFAMHAVGYVLVILKSLANPLIFALRQTHIKAALQRLFYLVICNAAKAREVEAARMWQRSFRGASSSFTTRSTYRVTRPGPPPSRPSTIKVILEEEKAEAEQETLM